LTAATQSTEEKDRPYVEFAAAFPEVTDKLLNEMPYVFLEKGPDHIAFLLKEAGVP
jgi:hypothetical protein